MTRSKLVAPIPVLVGLLLLYAGFTKAHDASGLSTALAFDDLPPSWISSLALLIVQAEIILGLALAMGVNRELTIWAAVALFGLYSAQLAYFLTVHRPPACGCLGALEHFKSARTAAGFGLGRNLLILAALLAYRRISAPRDRQPGESRNRGQNADGARPCPT